MQLGKTAQKLILGAKLAGLGHAPHIEVPAKLHAAVLEFLAGVKP